MTNKTEMKCFVPNCINKKILDDREPVQQRLHFFQVPCGIEGLFWEKSVRIRKRKYDKMIDLLSSNDYTLGLDKAPPTDYEYCCELHFDIDADIETILQEGGGVEYRVRPGAVPQMKPKQNKKLLCDYNEIQGVLPEEDIEMKIEIIKKEAPTTLTHHYEECSYEATTNGYISLVDISTLTNKNEQNCCDSKTINYEPMMPMLPLTMAMMKRKSPYYMGLQPNHFLQLLELAKQEDISDVEVMITLRKLRLNEEFEALSDLFDLDKTTTERYYEESKDRVAHLVDNLDTRDDKDSVQHSSHDRNSNAMVQMEEEEDDDPTESSSSSSSYVPSETDPDVMTDDLSEESNEWFKNRGSSLRFRTRPLFRLNLNKTTCGLCLQKFDTNFRLRDHQRQAHDGNSYGCDVCNKTFSQRRQIDRHILFRHAESKTFLCDICGKGFPYQSELTLHLKRTHCTELLRRYGCHLCDNKYLTLPTLRDHVRAVHSLERPFVCEFNGCGKSFSRKNVLLNHKRVHAADKFECNLCTKQFSLKGNLKVHKRNIHGMMS